MSPSVMFDADTKIFILDKTNNTIESIDNLGEYIYSVAYLQTKKQNNEVYGW